MRFTNKIYDRLKFFTLIVLPAFTVFYLGLGQLWGFPEAEKVGASIGLLAAFLGALLQISNSAYNGAVVKDAGVISPNGKIDPDTGIPGLALTINKPSEELLAGKEVRLKVSDTPPTQLVEGTELGEGE